MTTPKHTDHEPFDVEFWIDPACPWCWVTSRWILDVAPHRNLNIVWRPISLLFKNKTQPDSPFYDVVNHTLGLLRVLESVRKDEGEQAVGNLYTVIGTHIHPGRDRAISAEAALAEAGLPAHHAAAYHETSWDDLIREQMADGLSLTGDDVGTPIIAFRRADGRRVGFFGPVITRRLPEADALDLWDGMMLMAKVDGFWELKRTRTEGPDFSPPVG